MALNNAYYFDYDNIIKSFDGLLAPEAPRSSSALPKKQEFWHVDGDIAKGLQIGDKVELVLTGTVGFECCELDRVPGTARYGLKGNPVSLFSPSLRALKVTEKVPPTWRVGDTIRLRFMDYGTSYTYTRGQKDWPGDSTRLTDGKVDTLYRKGLVKHLVRDGAPVKDA